MPGMRPSERVPFTTIDKRPRLSMPNGERIIVWPILALEVWNIDRAMARMVISPTSRGSANTGSSKLVMARIWDAGWILAVKKMMGSLSIRPTVTLNARVCEEYPEVATACLDAGWEFNAHSYEQLPMHQLMTSVRLLTTRWM